MNIFENLENLNVSEECFDDIINIVEAIFEGWAATHTINDLDAKVKNSVVPRKEKYERAIATKESPEKINQLKTRYHSALVLNQHSNKGNKKEQRGNAVTAKYGDNPTVQTLRDTKPGEEPEVANKYIRELRNLGKPESQKEHPNMKNIYTAKTLKDPSGKTISNDSFKDEVKDYELEQRSPGALERREEKKAERERKKEERESKKTREKRERDAIDAHIKNELEELKRLNSFLTSPRARDSAAYQRRIDRRNELQGRLKARNSSSRWGDLFIKRRSKA